MSFLTLGLGTLALLIGGDLLFAVGVLSLRDLRAMRRGWGR